MRSPGMPLVVKNALLIALLVVLVVAVAVGTLWGLRVLVFAILPHSNPV